MKSDEQGECVCVSDRAKNKRGGREGWKDEVGGELQRYAEREERHSELQDEGFGSS